ncbi:Predicted phosphoglycerate mutase [Phaffia rhodozyma]|uniref:Predicted phosphoglycerate mutase n=1 Tax=Phaffia rhodozyma TaxID=264483 RepID=A0A0F7SS92_PHARH|nr:Predicted phosphoglycerate mutase [Phaffia rhodozyma]
MTSCPELVGPLIPKKQNTSVHKVIYAEPISTGNIRTRTHNRFKLMAHQFEHVVEGFFLQDAPSTGKVASAVLPRLGLIDDSPTRWDDFRKTIKKLQNDAPRGTFYKAFYLQRHGQGFHNVAESKYGTDSWNDYWSKLYTDGNLTWGPDPSLTSLGIEQAKHVNAVWKEELALSPPFPEIIWSSPLRRAADTLVWTYQDTAMNGSSGVRPMFKENLRESIGLHTCDARSTSYFLRTTYGTLENPHNAIRFEFEPSFETHDILWKPDQRESEQSQIERTRKVVDELFREYSDQTFVSLVGHGGTISSFFKLVDHKDCEAPTGSLIPVIVKAKAT